MLYWLETAFNLESFWGPLRLLRSHALMLGLGAFTAALLVWLLLPRLSNRLPRDRGKTILGKTGMVSAGKPTGAGLYIVLLTMPVAILVSRIGVYDIGIYACLLLAMFLGYWDDRSIVPWGRMKKGLTDALVAVALAWLLYVDNGPVIWWPFIKGTWIAPWFVYIPCSAFLLWIVMNSTNCSDGVDGLAGTLSLIALVFMSLFLYLVTGYKPVSEYFLIPHNPNSAKWAIALMTFAGATAGYLWHNAEPSRVLMGDAGSRFLGLAMGAGILATGNPFLVFAFIPILLINGGGGIIKLSLLKIFGAAGADIRISSKLDETERSKQNPVVKALHACRFPLHDHCRAKWHWSNAQVLLRFSLLQAFAMPLVFLLFVKIR